MGARQEIEHLGECLAYAARMSTSESVAIEALIARYNHANGTRITRDQLRAFAEIIEGLHDGGSK